ncbi:MAG: NAD(P)/FAD-dependent oxidoreductase [bacterium]
MKNNDFNVLVIGAGPGGTAAGVKSAQLGARVGLIEKSLVGGTCLHWGCIPTKALIQSGILYKQAQKLRQFGVQVAEVKLDFETIQMRKDRIIKQLRAGNERVISSYGITVLNGQASFKDKHTLNVVSSDGSHKEYTADHFIIASGSISKKYPQFKDESVCITTDEALNFKSIPSSLVIVGAGSVGLEFASLFSMLGVQVHVVEMLEQILPSLDTEVSGILIKELQRQGISMHTASQIFSVENNKVRIKKQNGEISELDAEKIIWAAGRKAYIDNLELSNADITYNEKGIVVDAHMMTSNKQVYAVGDAAGICQLAYTASAEGVVAAGHALGAESTMDYNGIPYALYTEPQTAWVGACEGAHTGRFPLLASSKAAILGNRTGMIKLHTNAEGIVMGVHMIGPGVTELIPIAAHAVKNKMHIRDWKRQQFTHPSLNETLFMAGEDCYENIARLA